MELWRKHDIIIDTCVFLWVVNNEQKKLSKLAKKAINEAQNIYVSCMSYAEILRKVKVGKMSFSISVHQFWKEGVSEYDMQILNVDDSIIESAFGDSLPYDHKDPVDRIILASAIVNDLVLLTPDDHIHSFKKGLVLWN